MDLNVFIPSKPNGYLLTVYGPHSPYVDYKNLFVEIMDDFPHLVINCQINNKDEHKNSPIFANGKPFHINSLNPYYRLKEKNRLKDDIRSRCCVIDYKKDFDIQNITSASWYLNGDRKLAENKLQTRDRSFYIRNGIGRPFELSYMNNSNIYHSQISPFEDKFYFSGLFDNKEIKGTFFLGYQVLFGIGIFWN